MTIKKIAVIGSGVMGGGIAAQVANGQTEVLLLDIVADHPTDRNHLANRAIEAMQKAKPPPLMDPQFAGFITVGNLEDDLEQLGDCDWIIEVVLENLDIKKDLYQKIGQLKKPGTIVSSNTSTLPLSVLSKDMPDSFCRDFLITHFFNPPRYMQLVEVVTSSQTSPQAVRTVTEFIDQRLGKSVVMCNDTPGFIANRIGTYWLLLAICEASKEKIGVEAADQVLSRPFGIPKTGVFGLMDLIGLDLMPHILASLNTYLGVDDPFHALGAPPALLDAMIADGYTGRKGKGGFYRLTKERKKEVISLVDGTYSPARRVTLAAAQAGKKNIRALFNHASREGRYAWLVMSRTLSYVAALVPEIADDIESVDRAMRLGYNWKYGPFELLDRIGGAWFMERLRAEGRPVPQLLVDMAGRPFYRVQKGKLQFHNLSGEYKTIKRAEGVILLSDIKLRTRPLLSNCSASLWDIGDKIACLEFHSKMNSVNLFTLAMIHRTVKKLPQLGFKGLVIHNEGPHFSAGANILMLLVAAKLRLWPLINFILDFGQKAFGKLKYAPFPVVGAPSGMALGGGCELLLHCNAVEAHAESYLGLVEAGVGMVPGWGGCKELLGRWPVGPNYPKGPMPAAMQAFDTIAKATVANSAYEAQKLHFLKLDDGIVMNHERVLGAAKKRTLALARNYKAPAPFFFHLAGPSGAAAFQQGINDLIKKGGATEHDGVVARELAAVLTGGETDQTKTLTETDILALERKAILKLVKTAKTRARIAHILKTGRPLHN
jgi:3-hydroxyacyl-CoA dehydrogenase